MPLYACRQEWCADYCARGSATPIYSPVKTDPHAASSHRSCAASTTREKQLCRAHDNDDQQRRLPPLLLCAASTGTGKSALIPLYALDTHWALLEQRLMATIDVYDDITLAHGAQAATLSFRPFPLDSHESFIREFMACSRLCIVVSQPTRVACAELAAYANALLGCSRTCASSTDTPATAPEDTNPNSGGHSDNRQHLLSRQVVGKRVGFAVGGESRFCPETEIVFATPGYILNALQLSHPRSPPSLSLSPTTLVVDEAHCRDIETDALLTWMKLSRERTPDIEASAPDSLLSLPVLRQYYVVSATMNLRAMDAYLCRGLKREVLHGTLPGRDGPVTDQVPADAPLLLLSPAQRRQVRRWWIREQSPRTCGRVDDADVDLVITRAVGTDQRVRAAVLQLVESIEGHDECGDEDRDNPQPIGDATHVANISLTDSSAERRVPGLFPSGPKNFSAAAAAARPPRVSPPHNRSELRSADGAAIVISTKPHRVERYFVDDLDPVSGCFTQSHVLFDEVTRRHASAAASTAAARTPSSTLMIGASGGGRSGRLPEQNDTVASSAAARNGDQWSRRGVPICLTDDGAALRAWLVDLHGTRAASYAMLSAHARALVELILQLLQAARYRWIDSAGASTRRTASTSTPQSQHSEHVYYGGDDPSRRSPTSVAAANLPVVEAPVTVLVFVAGIGELHQIMLALERRCDTVHTSASVASSEFHNAVDSSVPSTPVLRHGNEVFSVGLLHSSAVGSPQEQLMASEHARAPLRLLLSTNVAESSLTIPNTRIVVDTCLERRVSSDDVTGATRVLTSFVSPSGLRQRCGRVGRTGDGIVIHLAPRRFVLPDTLMQPLSTTQAASPSSLTTGPFNTPSSLAAAAAAAPTLEALPDDVAAVLLRLKFLFPKVSKALAALPSPPEAGQASLALQRLADADLLVLPGMVSTTPISEVVCAAATVAAPSAPGQRRWMESRAVSPFAAPGALSSSEDGASRHFRNNALLALLDESVVTPKGRLVASLPLPYEHAILVYHGLQFCCVEDAVMVACAMAVPSLFLTPRVSPRSAVQVGARSSTKSDYAPQRRDVDSKPALSPLEQFYRHLWVQRYFAGFSLPQGVRPIDDSLASEADEHTPTTATASTSEEERQVGQLSEPLMLRALLRQWYALPNANACVRFQNMHGLNRSAMRQVDNMVAQTCGRLIRLLLQLNTASTEASEEGPLDSVARRFVVEDSEAEVDFSAYVCQADAVVGSCAPLGTDTNTSTRPGRSGRHTAVDLVPFLGEWSAETQAELLRSLRRLQRVAVGRVRLRHADMRQRYGLPQWYANEERRIRLWGRPYLGDRSRDRRAPRVGGREASAMDHSQLEGVRETTEAVRRHPCFTYWANGLPALQSPYPSLYRQQHTKFSLAGHAATPLSSSVPPPLSTRVTRSKVPIYRAPSPPPPIPHVAFLMGRTDDRLCAAFVAAFGHRTLRGEDGGHRFHHSRLLRNMQALGNDEEHVCTFNIDVQQQQQQQQDVASSPLSCGGSTILPDIPRRVASKEEDESRTGYTAVHEAPLSPSSNSHDLLRASGVTLESVERALSPYLRGAGLQQLELFQSNRLAVAARFVRDGFTGLFDSRFPSSPHTLGINVGSDHNANDEANDAVSAQHSHAARAECHSTAGGARSPQATPAPTTSETAPTDTRATSADGAHTLPEEDLLKAAVLPSPLRYADVGKTLAPATLPSRDSSTRRSHPYVQLAPFGVSLLAAATAGTGGGGGGSGLGGLQRIPLTGVAIAAPGSPTQSTQSLSHSLTTVPTSATVFTRQESSVADERRSVRFSEVSPPPIAATARSTSCGDAGVTETTTTCVSWPDSLGICGRSITRAAVEALGLADLFPTAPSPSKNSSLLDSHGARVYSRHANGSPTAAPATALASANPNPPDGTATPAALTFSVLPPIYVTRSITWKVPLPTLTHQASSVAHATRDRITDTARLPVHYCILCNRIYANKGALHQHYRSASHLEHLYYAVLLRIRREHLETLYGWAPRAAGGRQCVDAAEVYKGDHSDLTGCEGCGDTPLATPPGAASLPLASLLCLQSATYLPLTQHVYPCVIGAHSFLNCLQWFSGDPTLSSQGQNISSTHKAEGRAAQAGRATPLAVAGTLVAMQSVADVLPPPHLRQSSLSNRFLGDAGLGASSPSSSVDANMLSAHHVWVLDLSNSNEANAAALTSTPPLTSTLFVVAGYLAAASPKAMVALLFNAAHTHLHAVMLYGLGVWRLPTPLPMEGYMGLLEHITRGGGWPGVLVPMANGLSDKRQKRAQETLSDATPGLSDGLHWCLPEASCAIAAEEHGCRTSAVMRAEDGDALVEATLLLVLHEYLQAGRKMVILADYVERVMYKLHRSPFLAPAAQAAQGIGQSPPAVGAAEVLTTYLKRVRSGQTIQALLRDLGCIFATPSRALATLLDPASASVDVRDAEGNCSVSQGPPSEGGSREASLSPAAVLSKRLSHRALGAEGAVVEMMFTVPPALPSRLPSATFAARLRQFYVECHAHRWASLKQTSAMQPRTGNVAVGNTARHGNGRPGIRGSQGHRLHAPQAVNSAGSPRKLTNVDERENLPQF
ncbi:hypothetical protein JKF63_07471 [Porcisia hertigi]|uniref:Helicase C-terminal domain-containing protein n=1 Tax=Porcisia hertigi TaxID=2761500 RepID=A0A836LF03_9TRYP|nr:hypothetical protein JKF63_07471 [Porcisia hertigi]